MLNVARAYHMHRAGREFTTFQRLGQVYFFKKVAAISTDTENKPYGAVRACPFWDDFRPSRKGAAVFAHDVASS
jgi:hypothetical protein